MSQVLVDMQQEFGQQLDRDIQGMERQEAVDAINNLSDTIDNRALIVPRYW